MGGGGGGKPPPWGSEVWKSGFQRKKKGGKEERRKDLHARPVGRDFLRAQIDDAKRSITKSKSLPSQLAACSAALGRAKTRCEKARKVAEAAQTTFVEELGNVQHLEVEARRIESEIASSGECAASPNSIEDMASALKRVLAEMRRSSVVPEHVVCAAQQAMEGLYVSVTAVATEAAAVAAAADSKVAAVPPRAIKRAASAPGDPPADAREDIRRKCEKTYVPTPCGIQAPCCIQPPQLVERELVPQADLHLVRAVATPCPSGPDDEEVIPASRS